ncbi:acyl-CoA dehydrogenase family protein [Croceicoccus sp. YJ47]|uniref:acyl-CoA dehydrogenase family protein n=1 Tax=Croceicoccus sp. YJ47 TaxID=2798724 RepID=UPI0019231A08|nr:acyl-CoA dehydrogenase family protein [Croceicoccus sp. YJ47]QQN75368.1 acyl-CoA dehydrogenase family protein [Croceicoccus sp. YJ47]
MDFSLGQDRQMLVDSLGRYLSANFDFSTREKALVSVEGFSRDMWAGLAELGVIGALFTEDAGGYGGGAFDIGAVFGEIGRAIALGPFLGTLMAGRVLQAAGETDVIESLISGETIVTFAHEPAIDGEGVMADPASATRAGEGWTVSGAKGVVPYLAGADVILVTAETDGGLSTFLVERGADGVTVSDYPLVDGGSAGELSMKDAPARLIGEAGAAQDAIDDAIAAGLVALSWEAVAVMDVLRASTLDYMKTRKQFGIPIGKFQALQHRMATVALEIEQARSAAINAAAMLHEDPVKRDRAASAAKYTVGKTGVLAAEEALQLHGGIGMTWELPLSHYAKRMIMIGSELGGEDEHLERFIALGQKAA